MQANHLFAKLSQFGVQQVDYLGHIISLDGVAMDPQKISVVHSWPIPKSVKALRGLLGLTGYYRKFIRHYGQIVAPLTTLLHKDSFAWSPETDKAFSTLKTVMTTAPILALPNFAEQFIVECDACSTGMGVVLMQSNRPVACLSKSFSRTQLGLSVYEKEMETIIFAVHRWKSYLTGRQFIIRTDHQSLRYLLQQ